MDPAHFSRSLANLLEALNFAPHAAMGDPASGEGMAKAHHHLPILLQAFYAQLPAAHPAMSAHHLFFAPTEVTEHEGGLILCEENERVVHWGVACQTLNDPDPPVSQWNWTTHSWCADCPNLSQFLLNMLCWQLLCLAPFMGRASYTILRAQAVRNLLQPACDRDDYDLLGYFANNVACCCMIPQWIFLGCSNEQELVSWQNRLGVPFDWL